MGASVANWAATLAVGIALGLGARACLCPGRIRKGPWWVAAVVGLGGALIGRLVLDVALFGWHSRFWGGVFGALVVSLVWSAIARMAPAEQRR